MGICASLPSPPIKQKGTVPHDRVTTLDETGKVGVQPFVAKLNDVIPFPNESGISEGASISGQESFRIGVPSLSPGDMRLSRSAEETTSKALGLSTSTTSAENKDPLATTDLTSAISGAATVVPKDPSPTGTLTETLNYPLTSPLSAGMSGPATCSCSEASISSRESCAAESVPPSHTFPTAASISPQATVSSSLHRLSRGTTLKSSEASFPIPSGVEGMGPELDRPSTDSGGEASGNAQASGETPEATGTRLVPTLNSPIGNKLSPAGSTEKGGVAARLARGGSSGVISKSGSGVRFAGLGQKGSSDTPTSQTSTMTSAAVMALLLGGDVRPTYLRDAVDEEGSGSSHCDGFPLQLKPSPGGQGIGAGMGALVMPNFGRGLNRAAPGSSKLSNHSSASSNAVASASKEGTLQAASSVAPDEQGFTQAALAAAGEGTLNLGTLPDGVESQDAYQPRTRGMGSMTAWQALADQVMEDLAEEDANEDAAELSASSSANGRSRQETDEGECSPGPLSPAALTEIIARPGGTLYVQYELQRELGEGAFGKAILARRRRDGELFVVKMMHGAGLTEKAREEMRNEVKVLANLSHPNIVKYYDCFADRDDRLVIVMEYCDDGDLDSFLRRRNGQLIPEKDIMVMFVQICLGLHHVHTKGIIHRDFKTNNCFICSPGILKLGDFGISKVLSGKQQAAKTMVGTPYYMSPEALKGKAYDTKTDVWAAGCVLYELCTLKRAFDGNNLGAITVKIMGGKFPPVPASYSDDMKNLVGAMLKKDPDARMSFEDILALPYVQMYMEDYMDHVRRNVVRRRSSFERCFTSGMGLTGSGTCMPESHASDYLSGEGQIPALPISGALIASILGGDQPQPEPSQPVHDDAEQAISAAEAERLAMLATMRAQDSMVNLLKLKEFKQLVRRQHVQAQPDPLLPTTSGAPDSPGRSSHFAAAGPRSIRSLSISIPRTPLAALVASTPYAGAMNEVQDDAEASTEDATVIDGSPQDSPFPSASGIRAHPRFSQVASAA